MATNRRRHTESLKPRRAVLLDTNFLFIPLRHKVDIFRELETLLGPNIQIYIIEATLQELEYLKQNAKPSLIKEIDFAEKLSKKCIILETSNNKNETTDDKILRIALELDLPVATNDKELRKRLKREKITVIFLRQRAYLDIEG